MINLLPPQEKQELLKERQKNLVVVLTGITAIALVCLMLILFSIKLYILEEIGAQRTMLEGIEEQYRASDAMSLKKSIEGYNARVATMNYFYGSQLRSSQALELLLAISRPEGVRLTNLDLQQDEQAKTANVVISGTSNTRDDLLQFKNTLEGAPGITNVNFPPESWVKPAGIEFTVTLTINANHE